MRVQSIIALVVVCTAQLPFRVQQDLSGALGSNQKAASSSSTTSTSSESSTITSTSSSLSTTTSTSTSVSVTSSTSTLSLSTSSSSVITTTLALPTLLPSTTILPVVTVSPSPSNSNSTAGQPTSHNNFILVSAIVAGAILISVIGIYIFRKTALKQSKGFDRRLEPDHSTPFNGGNKIPKLNDFLLDSRQNGYHGSSQRYAPPPEVYTSHR